MTIKQFNATYFVADDRLLFRFNTDEDKEFHFWLTRRVTLFILAATQHLIVKSLEEKHSPEAALAIANFGREAIQVNSSATAPDIVTYQPANEYPLGADPLLVMDVKCALEKQGLEDILSLDLLLPGGANINLKMAGSILQAVCVLLNQLREHAAWGDMPKLVDNNTAAIQTEKSDKTPSFH